MNESRFFMFFTVMFDLHNLQKEGKLRSVAHPRSPLRWQLLSDPQDYESLLLKTKADISDDVIDIFQDMEINDEKEDIFPCSECDNIYKKPWTLKTHLRKKHNISKDGLEFKCDICEEVFPDQNNLAKHKKIHQTIFACGALKY